MSNRLGKGYRLRLIWVNDKLMTVNVGKITNKIFLFDIFMVYSIECTLYTRTYHKQDYAKQKRL